MKEVGQARRPEGSERRTGVVVRRAVRARGAEPQRGVDTVTLLPKQRAPVDGAQRGRCLGKQAGHVLVISVSDEVAGWVPREAAASFERHGVAAARVKPRTELADRRRLVPALTLEAAACCRALREADARGYLAIVTRQRGEAPSARRPAIDGTSDHERAAAASSSLDLIGPGRDECVVGQLSRENHGTPVLPKRQTVGVSTVCPLCGLVSNFRCATTTCVRYGSVSWLAAQERAGNRPAPSVEQKRAVQVAFLP